MIANRDPELSNTPNPPGIRRATPPAGPSEPSRSVHRFVWAFGVVMVLIAGGGFGFKLYEFVSTFDSEQPLQFAIFPVVTYLMVAAGFGCLFMWAYLGGQFKNIEGAKYRMLEMQKEIDARDGYL